MGGFSIVSKAHLWGYNTNLEISTWKTKQQNITQEINNISIQKSLNNVALLYDTQSKTIHSSKFMLKLHS